MRGVPYRQKRHAEKLLSSWIGRRQMVESVVLLVGSCHLQNSKTWCLGNRPLLSAMLHQWLVIQQHAQ